MRPTRLLNEIRERLLLEASLDDLNTSSMAVVVDASQNSAVAVVYNVAAIEGHDASNKEIPVDAIVGFVNISAPRGAPCRGAWQIRGITGPGKIVYSLAYALSPTGIVVPDRSNVSQDASDAWMRYAAKNPKNVLPLDDADHPKRGTDPYHDAHHTEDPSDDCFTSHTEDHLNAAYRGPGGETALLDRLVDAHEALMKKMAAGGTVVADLEAAILDAGFSKFDKVMGY